MEAALPWLWAALSAASSALAVAFLAFRVVLYLALLSLVSLKAAPRQRLEERTCAHCPSAAALGALSKGPCCKEPCLALLSRRPGGRLWRKGSTLP